MMTDTGRQRLKYILSDYLTVSVGWLVFNIIRYHSLPEGYITEPLGEWLIYENLVLEQIIYPPMMIILYAISGFYNNVRQKSRFDDLTNTLVVSLLGMLLIFFITLLNDSVPERMANFVLMSLLWGCLCLPTFIARSFITLSIRARYMHGESLYKAVIVGTGRDARALYRRLSRPMQVSEFKVDAFISTDDHCHKGNIDGVSVYPLSEINDVTGEFGTQAIIAAEHMKAGSTDMDMLSLLFRTGCDIYVPLDTYRLLSSRRRVSSVVSEPLVNITSADIPPSTANIKRLLDIAVSSLALVILSPVFVAIAIAIRRDSEGPVFYLQERVGYHKKLFNIIKFRTMRVDAESDGPALSSADDDRVTKVGRFLRKYRLDELPQFWNVVKGDMSLVGPRPEREYFVRRIVERVPQYSLVHQVRPGITSWGMVKYGYARNVDEMIERLRFDLLYLENLSLGVDVKILFHTVHTVITGKGL